MEEPKRMIPLTESVLSQMVARVLEALQDRGLVEPGPDGEKTADQVMRLCDAQGLVEEGNLPLGRCLLLPRREDELFSLLLVTPWPADEYSEDLCRLPSPVQCQRNHRDQIVLPVRFLLAKFDEVANNPAVPESTRALALQLSRRVLPGDILMPSDTKTIAITIPESDGTTRMIEALPAGLVISVGTEE